MCSTYLEASMMYQHSMVTSFASPKDVKGLGCPLLHWVKTKLCQESFKNCSKFTQLAKVAVRIQTYPAGARCPSKPQREASWPRVSYLWHCSRFGMDHSLPRGQPALCQVLSSILGLCPVDVNSKHPPQLTTSKERSPDIVSCSLGAK